MENEINEKEFFEKLSKKKNAKEVTQKLTAKAPQSKALTNDALINYKKGDNERFLRLSMKLVDLPEIDIMNYEEVKQRIVEYFEIHAQLDMKPTVMGLGMALGIDRRRLWEIKTGNTTGNNKLSRDIPTKIEDLVKKAYFMMENQWEQYMLNGKINPITGIFLGKNNFGYQDKSEYVLTPNNQQQSEYDIDDIKKRYLTDTN